MSSSLYNSPTKFGLEDLLYDDFTEFSCSCNKFVSHDKHSYLEHVDKCIPARSKHSIPSQVSSHRSRNSQPLQKTASNLFMPRSHSEIYLATTQRCRRYKQTDLDIGKIPNRYPAKARGPPTPPITPLGSGSLLEMRSNSPALDAVRQSTPELSDSDGSDSSGGSNDAIHNLAALSIPSTPTRVPITPSSSTPERLFLRSPSPPQSEFEDLDLPIPNKLDLVLDEELLPPSSRASSPAQCAINEFLSRLGGNLECLTPIFFRLGIMDGYDLDFLSTLSVEDLHSLFPLQSVDGLHVNFMQREYIKEGLTLRTRIDTLPTCQPCAPPRTISSVPEDDSIRQSVVWDFLSSLWRPLTEHFEVFMNDGVINSEDFKRLAYNPRLQAELRQFAPCMSKLSALDWMYIQHGLRRYRQLLEQRQAA